MYEEIREKKLKVIEAAKLACDRNPNDSQTWKDWAAALIDILGASDDKEKDKEYLKDAIKKLEKAVEVNEGDLDARWKLGEALMYTSWVDIAHSFNHDLYMEDCFRALDCFTRVRKVDPTHCQQSHMPDMALQCLENLKRLAPACVTPELPEGEVTKLDEMPEEFDETETSSNGEKFCEVDWNNIHNWEHEYYQKKLMELVHSTNEAAEEAAAQMRRTPECKREAY